MSSIEVRPFHRRDREQLTALVNAHAAAVVPGMSVSVATVLGQLEREPGEFIIDPWVSDRVTLVAEQHDRVAAAAHLLRYVYGVPEQWPHIGALYERAGFRHTGHTEVVYLAAVGDLPHPGGPPAAGLAVRRSVGINGTRMSAVIGGAVAGYLETEILEEGERLPRHGRWADLGNLHVAARYRRRGVATWLLAHAADWLRLARADRLLSYAWRDGEDETGQGYDGYRAFLAASGFRELTRTRRGWTRG